MGECKLQQNENVGEGEKKKVVYQTCDPSIKR